MSEIGTRYVSKLTRNTYAIILAGGRGSRLYELTEWRAKPALFFGGKFRIIDFPLSNCINSGIRRIGVVTQYKAHSLIKHLVRGWGHFKKELGEGVEILPASQRYSDNWYQGTADAVYQNIDIIRGEVPTNVLILSGDHDGLAPILDAVHNLVEELGQHRGAPLREITQMLVLTALGDGMIGGPISAALELPRETTRATLARQLGLMRGW